MLFSLCVQHLRDLWDCVGHIVQHICDCFCHIEHILYKHLIIIFYFYRTKSICFYLTTCLLANVKKKKPVNILALLYIDLQKTTSYVCYKLNINCRYFLYTNYKMLTQCFCDYLNVCITKVMILSGLKNYLWSCFIYLFVTTAVSGS